MLARCWLTFVVLGASFLVFGSGSLNLVYTLKANVDLITEHGWMALADDAAQQLAEIVVTAYVSMAAYIVFKIREYSLVHALIYPSAKDSTP